MVDVINIESISFFFPRSPDFYDKFQYVANNIEGSFFSFFFLVSYVVCSQIWLNHLMDDRIIELHHKIEKKAPGSGQIRGVGRDAR